MKAKKGFSLVELVVVIAVMSILVGLTSLGLTFLKSKDTKEVAYGIESSLTKLKSLNMTRTESNQLYLHLYVEDGKYYRIYTKSTAAATPDGSEKELGNTSMPIQVTYDVKDADGKPTDDRVTTLESAKDICIGISRKDGSFLYQPSGDGSEAPRELLISSSSGMAAYRVYMVTDTGKHFVEVP